MKRYRFHIAILILIILSLFLSHLDNRQYLYTNKNKTGGEPYYYTVNMNESLSVIADNTRPPNIRFNTWLEEIEFINGMDKDTVIYPGEMIKIPQ